MIHMHCGGGGGSTVKWQLSGEVTPVVGTTAAPCVSGMFVVLNTPLMWMLWSGYKGVVVYLSLTCCMGSDTCGW